jgi:DNA-binding transcriptional MerR regulator
MNEIKDLLDDWKNDGLSNPGALEKAYDAIALLVSKVEELEQRIEALETSQ